MCGYSGQQSCVKNFFSSISKWKTPLEKEPGKTPTHMSCVTENDMTYKLNGKELFATFSIKLLGI